MTTSEPIKAANAFPGELALTMRRRLGNRKFLLAAAIVALVAGAALNWAWRVALGSAPVLLSVLPCVVMCGLGVCCMKMMGGSGEKQPGQSGTAAEIATSPAALGIPQLNKPSLDGSTCCQGDVGRTQPPQVKPALPLDERRDSLG